MQLLHAKAPLATRDFARTYVWGLWLLSVAIDPVADLAMLPATSFEPAGLACFVPESLREALLSSIGILFLKTSTLVALGLAACSVWRKPMSVTACLLLTLYQGVLHGYGHINHAEVSLLLAAYLVTWFDCVDFHEGGARPYLKSSRRSKHAAAAPLTAIAVVLCVTYLFTGMHRLMTGGMSLFTGNHLEVWMTCAVYSPRGYGLEAGAWLLRFDLFRWSMLIGFPVVTLFEILAPLCLVSRRFRVVFAAVMIPFHLMVLVTMGILFWQSLALYVFLLDTPFWNYVCRTSQHSRWKRREVTKPSAA